MNTKTWNIRPRSSDLERARLSNYPPLLADLLLGRGITHAAAADAFLAADRRLLHDPALLPDMGPAVRRLLRAIRDGEPVAVYGDFDADGITATALLVTGLRTLGAEAQPYIPDRFTEGYGLNTAALETLQRRGAGLVITVDTGTSAFEEIATAAAAGLDLIVTDHHSIPAELPPAVAIINPHRTDGVPYPFPDLTGVGVAWKLLCAVAQELGVELDERAYLDLVAIGTVADLGPLTGENRYFVRRGLESLNATARPGLRAMFSAAGLRQGITSRDIAFMIAPRLNAAGRLDHAMLSYRLLTTPNRAEADNLAATLEALNRERRSRTDLAVTQAEEMVGDPGDDPIIVVGAPEFPSGLIGLVAGRLAEKWHRPAVVLEVGEETSRASCRSIPGFNVVEAVRACRDLLLRHGGHPQAAGFTVASGNLAALRDRLLDVAAQQLAGRVLTPSLEIDGAATLDSLARDGLPLLERLAPFGLGNPEPLFCATNVQAVRPRTMGSTGAHLQLSLKDGKTVWRAVGFNLGERLAEFSEAVDVVVTLETEWWQGQRTVRLNVRDVRAAIPEGAAHV